MLYTIKKCFEGEFTTEQPVYDERPDIASFCTKRTRVFLNEQIIDMVQSDENRILLPDDDNYISVHDSYCSTYMYGNITQLMDCGFLKETTDEEFALLEAKEILDNAEMRVYEAESFIYDMKEENNLTEQLLDLYVEEILCDIKAQSNFIQKQIAL